MEVKIDVRKAGVDEFSDIILSFEDFDNVNQEVSLNINFEKLYEFSRDTESISFDFILIASIIYGIDNLLERYKYSVDGWAREIKVEIPVNHISKWDDSKNILTEALNFLSGDYWDISFVKLTTTPIFKFNDKKKVTYNESRFEYVSLLSGGLDSLVGAIDLLESLKDDKKVMFASHFDSNSAGPNKDQVTLTDFLKKEYPDKFEWIQGKIFLSHYNNNGDKIDIETSYRSRSILFLAIGVYLQSIMPYASQLIIPENGTISINYPMTPSRSSSLSTRTTHPYFFSKVQELFDKVGIKCVLFNPYSFMTKGEVINECLNIENLKEICELSVSCSKTGRKMYWDERDKTRHCGACIPCIYRRSGLFKTDFDNQLYGYDILNETNPIKHNDVFALINYLNTPLTKEKIKRDIVINSSSAIPNLDRYAELIMRSREEVKKWIRDKGNEHINKLIY